MILFDAIQRAIDANGGRIPNRAQVRQAVAHTRELKGVTGVWSFDENGDPANPTVALYQVRQDRWSPLTEVTVKGEKNSPGPEASLSKAGPTQK